MGQSEVCLVLPAKTL